MRGMGIYWLLTEIADALDYDLLRRPLVDAGRRGSRGPAACALSGMRGDGWRASARGTGSVQGPHDVTTAGNI